MTAANNQIQIGFAGRVLGSKTVRYAQTTARLIAMADRLGEAVGCRFETPPNEERK
jgi:hypothetical protein